LVGIYEYIALAFLCALANWQSENSKVTARHEIQYESTRSEISNINDNDDDDGKNTTTTTNNK
jgi:hypothetical protein